jgi:hypothetical protein
VFDIIRVFRVNPRPDEPNENGKSKPRMNANGREYSNSKAADERG